MRLIVSWMYKIGMLISVSFHSTRSGSLSFDDNETIYSSHDVNNQVYGPHISALYVRSAALQHSVTQIVHHFLKVENVAYKLQPGGPGYEIVYGTTGVNAYLLSLTPKNDLKATFEAIAAHEQTILEPLLSFLTDPAQKARGVRIVGEETVNLQRLPTVSFVVIGQRPLKSRDIVDVFDKKGGVSDHLFPTSSTSINNILD